MIILDYSQVAISNILQFSNELKKDMNESGRANAINIIRHAVLSSLKMYKKKYGKEYGELVIACDGQNYWRRDVFPHYKAGRSKSRDKSDLDWKLIFDVMSELRKDLEQFFPYKVIHFDKAEADDIIACLTKWTQTNQLASDGLYEEPQKVLILSSDGDFIQLQKYDNVSQWSPIQKKQVSANKREVTEKRITHIVKASDDGIPNILSDDDVFVIGKRQTPVMAKRLAEFIEKGRDACQNDYERRNWDRNQQLVDFDFIPEDIYNSIIDQYVNKPVTGNKNLVMNYLMQHRCRVLLEEIGDF